MVALTARFVTPRKPVAAPAFGGLVDLCRIFFQPGRSMPVVCSECQTINRFSAKVCKGCDGKLPAFYTAGDPHAMAPSGAFGAFAAVGAPARAPSGARALAVPARWVTVVWIAGALIALFGAFGLWYALHSSAARPVSAQHAPLALMPAPAPRAAESVPPAADLALTADASKAIPPPAQALVDGPIEAPPSAVRQVVRAPIEARPVEPRPEARRRAAVPPVEPRAAAVPRAAAASPLAMCGELNFFARAICLNNTCAQPARARHPQCVQVLRQRRLDEARRNPTLFN